MRPTTQTSLAREGAADLGADARACAARSASAGNSTSGWASWALLRGRDAADGRDAPDRAPAPRAWPGTHTTRLPAATRGRPGRWSAGTRRSIRKRLRLMSRPCAADAVAGPPRADLERARRARPRPRRCRRRRRSRASLRAAACGRPGRSTRPGTGSGDREGGRRRRRRRDHAARSKRTSGLAAARQRQPAARRRAVRAPDRAGASTWTRPTPRRPPARASARRMASARHRARGRARARRATGRSAALVRARARRASRAAAASPAASASSARTAADARQRLAHARVEALLEVRQQLVPHAVARGARVGVRRVLAPGQPARRQVREHVRARHARAAAAGGRRVRGAHARPSPRRPEPRSRRSSTVSAWSSRVCATAITRGALAVAGRARRNA